jgi:hypothetical protein
MLQKKTFSYNFFQIPKRRCVEMISLKAKVWTLGALGAALTVATCMQEPKNYCANVPGEGLLETNDGGKTFFEGGWKEEGGTCNRGSHAAPEFLRYKETAPAGATVRAPKPGDF